MTGIELTCEWDLGGIFAWPHPAPHDSMAQGFNAGGTYAEATRNAIARAKGPIGYLCGNGVDPDVAAEFNIPVRDE